MGFTPTVIERQLQNRQPQQNSHEESVSLPIDTPAWEMSPAEPPTFWSTASPDPGKSHYNGTLRDNRPARAGPSSYFALYTYLPDRHAVYSQSVPKQSDTANNTATTVIWKPEMFVPEEARRKLTR